jgi:hypothetical protein
MPEITYFAVLPFSRTEEGGDVRRHLRHAAIGARIEPFQREGLSRCRR